jgi:hypothetical protein
MERTGIVILPKLLAAVTAALLHGPCVDPSHRAHEHANAPGPLARCALATSGHASAAPPSSVMNARRFN